MDVSDTIDDFRQKGWVDMLDPQFWRSQVMDNVSTEFRIFCNRMYWALKGEPDEVDYDLPEIYAKEDREYYRFVEKMEFARYWKEYQESCDECNSADEDEYLETPVKHTLLILYSWKTGDSTLAILPLEIIHKICKML